MLTKYKKEIIDNFKITLYHDLSNSKGVEALQYHLENPINAELY